MSEQVATMLNSFTRVSFYTYMSYVPPIDTAMTFIHLTLIDNGFATQCISYCTFLAINFLLLTKTPLNQFNNKRMKVKADTPHGGADSQFKCFNQIAKSYFKKKPYQGYYLLMTFKLSMANCDTV